MKRQVFFSRCAMASLTALLVAGCSDFDFDMRGGTGQLDTTEAVLAPTAPAPEPDGRGVVSYPEYQVVLAQQGDTVDTISARVGLPTEDVARYNALPRNVELRQGAVVALPTRVGEPGSGAVLGTGSVDVATIAGSAIQRAEGEPGLPAGDQPVRHQVQPGETAFSIARTYSVPVSSLAEWNGLGPDLALRDGQYLLIPTTAATSSNAAAAGTTSTLAVSTIEPAASPPGTGSVTPVPPSASEPLPTEDIAPVAAAPAAATTPEPSPIAEEQTAASDTARLRMPVQGQIIRPFEAGSSDGIVISATAGADVVAADAGTVAQITRNTGEVQIIVLRHEGGLLTVYAGVDSINVDKGDSVGRGQKLAEVQAADPPFLQFEVREGFEATDPEQYFR